MERDAAFFALCENLKRLRIQHNLTEAELADGLRIGVRSIKMLESGAVPPRMGCDVLIRAASLFRISVKELLLPMT